MSDSRSSGSKLLVLVAFGMIIALLLLNVAVVAVDDVTDLNVSNVTPSPENTELPITLAADLVTPDATIVPTESLIIADETPADTPVTPTLFSGSSQFIDGPAEIVSTTGLSGISNPSTADIQYTVHTAKRVTQAQREAAAANYKDIREKFLLQGNTALPASRGFQIDTASFNGTPGPSVLTMDPGGVPHYFGPYANWANSPMPMGHIASIAVDNGGEGYTTAPAVSIADVYFTGSGATATATVAGGAVTGITVTNPGTNYTAPVVIIDGPGTGAAATATLGGPFSSGMRKFVDTLPGLNSAGANNLGQYIPVAQSDDAIYPGSNYYEIAIVQFTEKMHSDLPETTLRGYVQISTPNVTGLHYPLNYPNGTNITDTLGSPVFGVDKPHYLGPLIVANNGTPVRVKFQNYLPVGAEGNLFIPVDTTVMGAGMGPLGMNTTPIYYTQNRQELHLHGGTTPWISDGTPYQWITPAGEYTAYPKGVSVYNVPDMPDPGDGSMTFFYTNQQSARLMFYHDHAHGITRLNVYSGAAAGYIVRDQQERDMIDGTNVTGINPTYAKVLPDVGIPLIIQDKTWVDNRTIVAQDPTWAWGTDPGQPMTGDLWYPHVYMPAQNPYDDTGINPYGRWHYGPWFYPPTAITHGPVSNPYYGNLNFTGEPPMMPGTPNPSTPGEAFMDTPLVNGVAYPTMTVDPKTYRFRILNAANDRAVNLQLYVADPTVMTADGRNDTEVKMVPASPGTPGFPANWPTDGREGGVPDPATVGPSFIQIGTEGGFLPAPVVVPNQPITWVNDPTRFDFGNVDKHTVVLMSAERADVLVDFSAYAGKTLILYNDAPAAYPAGVPQYDYYTGDPDRTDTGGAPTTQAGYGPNIRTVMQIKVNNITPAPAYDLATLNSVFAKTASKRGVFESSQPPVIVPQVAYGSAYNQVFTQNNYGRINDHFKNFTALSGSFINITFQPKALHDEMGAVYDQYGRMSAMLGLEIPSPTSVTAQFMPYGYDSPPTDVIMSSVGEMDGVQAGDGTQIWKISHNGVDSHPIHWHMYNVQVINRVGWDGFIRAPDRTELGWKETVRVSPLEDTVIALRPVTASVPFEVPDQVRAITPTAPLGSPIDGPPGGGWFDPMGNPITTGGADRILNHLVNYGWEYVWHCHILAHEEMDMMHAQAISVNQPTSPPDTLTSGEVTDITNKTAVYLAWVDRSTNETDWIVQRCNLSDTLWYDFKVVPSYSGPQTGGWAMTVDDTIPVDTNPPYMYRIKASNVVGDDYVYDGGVVFPTSWRNSIESGINTSSFADPPNASFTYSPSTGDAALNVSFTDTSTGSPTGWIWDFGDGNFAADNGQQNPYHVYEIPGTYTVTLTAMNIGGSNVSPTTGTVIVTKAAAPAAPLASFTNVTPREGAVPLTVTFNADASTSDPAVWATWRWTFGDGTFSSVKNATHTYTTAGNYTVSLAATNLGGTDVMTRTGYINVSIAAPVANFSGTPRTGTAPLTVVFTDLSTNASTSWAWDFGDGNVTNATVQNPVHTYLLAGNYTVALTATNGAGSDTMTKVGYINVTSNNSPYSVGVYRPSTHMFYLRPGNWPVAPTTVVNWGISTDLPVTGDWNGDRIPDVGVYRSSAHTFYLKNGTVTTSVNWGVSTDTPVTGDWNGDGLTDVGIYRPSTHMFYLKNGSVTTGVNWGVSTDTPVTGDWNGDGLTDVGIFRPSTHMFYLKNGSVTTGVNWGVSTDTPVTGDWNGDGLTDVGIFRPSTHMFYMKNGSVTTGIDWGVSSDLPVTGKW
ncbi:PKD domain-containing protein [Methanoregula sp. PtaU1.Bin006]|uniref:PKD domain-containing protein n=1 Tax=Methanoregula sp. PtaU1.Bin006 TaxID=1811681 RepID=UPI0025EBB036|nr:PKD domain-containing protein [Methanoregula sp. PtaU1.Bin006]